MGISLVIADRDVVENHNLEAANTPFHPTDIGLAKALALLSRLRELAPQVPVEAYQAAVLLMPESHLVDLANGAGVVLGLIDNGEALFRIDQVFHHPLPVVYGAGHRRAHTGDVMISRPGDACLRCLLDVDSPADIQTLAGEPTHGIDIIKLSEWCARVALVLLGDARLGNADSVLPAGVNFIFLENRNAPGNPGLPAPRTLRIPRRPNCPVCGAW
jgi:molybdopterin/thiamine biosynthesis adenylyltransferase